MQKNNVVSHGYAKKKRKRNKAMTAADTGNNYCERFF